MKHEIYQCDRCGTDTTDPFRWGRVVLWTEKEPLNFCPQCWQIVGGPYNRVVLERMIRRLIRDDYQRLCDRTQHERTIAQWLADEHERTIVHQQQNALDEHEAPWHPERR